MKKKGRPSDFQTKYCREIISWMAKGFSIASFAGNIGVGEKTIYNWAKKYPQFLQSIKVGKAKSILFWEKIGILGMLGKIPHFNATAWIFQMKNRLGWSDKLTVDLELENNTDEIEEKTNKETPQEIMQRLVEKYGRKLVPPNRILH